MKKLNHGYISISITIAALIIGLIAMLNTNLLLGVSYGVYIIISFPIIAFVYCRKCPHAKSDTWKHYFVGKLTKFMPEDKGDAYKIGNYLSLLVVLILLIGIPQYWLIKNLFLLAGFWLLILISTIDVLTMVCKTCGNIYCPSCPKNRISKG